MKQGAHLTIPGWSKPHTHSNPTNLALFRHKITLYRFNQGAHTIVGGGGLKWEQGAEPHRAPLTLTTGYISKTTEQHLLYKTWTQDVAMAARITEWQLSSGAEF